MTLFTMAYGRNVPRCSRVDELYAAVVHNCASKGGQCCTIGSVLLPGCNVKK